MPRQPCVYILASRRHGAIYTGVTNDLARRVWQHKRGEGSEFTRRYQIDKLVWMEPHDTMIEAIEREKQIKRWSKARRRGLIEVFNPEWCDLYPDLA
ncbi:MAG: GIY-YIG nuclease family protein [Chloroflexota bacterium]|nr:GIY-YIG nuclease family protein [Chloroflexota bacterium]MDE2894649.1 GIY-YIG nuclease family protein [Chloroflexota bacterium]